jgi:alkanesulfonate monooxygenase SsuD/methylene tetrahydromethanopterin reductase-like flavin-dependent oxidoreductase (luciferase family)
LIKQTAFGIHLPVMSFDSNSDNRNIEKVKEKPHSREQLLSIARKAESLGYDSLSINDHIVFRTSWLDSLTALSAVASVTTKIKLGTSVLNIVVRNPVICAKSYQP